MTDDLVERVAEIIRKSPAPIMALPNESPSRTKARATIAECFKWRPIEEAPKDGSPILSYHPYDWTTPDVEPPYAVVRWNIRCSRWYFGLPGNYIQSADEVEPTYWIPLPDPPKENTP